jgi:hypothetical protein
VPAVRIPLVVAGKKRSVALEYTSEVARLPQGFASEPLHKRRRIHRASHTLDQFTLPKSVQFKDRAQPISPLFFSNTRSRPRPQLPARFSSSEAAARMLSNAQGEDSSIKTVTLARGSFAALSPPGLSSGRSSERSSIPSTASPEGRERDRHDPLRLLGSLGVAELLEQDNRPTFIIDIGDALNYTPGSTGLQIVFANHALRSNPAVWELLCGKASDQFIDDAALHATSQFKGWLLGTGIRGEKLDVHPSPIEHGGIIWTCYTLRRRLRVASGAVYSTAVSSIPSTTASDNFAMPSSSSAPLHSTSGTDQPQDYFGNSMATVEEQMSEDIASSPAPPLTTSDPDDPIESMDIVEESRTESNRVVSPPLRGYTSFTDESVCLRAQSAGDIDTFYRDPSAPQEQDVGFFDWTRLALSTSLPRHIQFARSIDWANTPLGPIEYWGNDLRAMCNLIM